MAHWLLTIRSVPLRAFNDEVQSTRFQSGEQRVRTPDPARSESAEFDLQHSLVKIAQAAMLVISAIIAGKA